VIAVHDLVFRATSELDLALFFGRGHVKVFWGKNSMNQLFRNGAHEHDDLAEVIKARAEVAISALRGLPDEMRKQVLETALRDLSNSKLKITLRK
jgi:hypothetical protein